MRAREDRVDDTHEDPFSEIIFKELVHSSRNRTRYSEFPKLPKSVKKILFFFFLQEIQISLNYALVMCEIVCYEKLKKARQNEVRND